MSSSGHLSRDLEKIFLDHFLSLRVRKEGCHRTWPAGEVGGWVGGHWPAPEGKLSQGWSGLTCQAQPWESGAADVNGLGAWKRHLLSQNMLAVCPGALESRGWGDTTRTTRSDPTLGQGR